MKLKIAILAAALAASSTAFAADKRMSVSVFGNISGSADTDPQGFISTSIGYLLTDSLEVGGVLSQFLSGGAKGSTTTSFGANVKYYFGSVGKAGATVPYVMASAQSSSSSSGGSSSTLLQGGGGLEFTMTENAATFVEAAAQRVSTGSNSSTGYQMNIGIKLRF